MATAGKTCGKDAVFKLDNQAGTLTTITTYIRSVTGLPGEKEMKDVTVLGSTGYNYFPCLQKCDFSVEGVFDHTANSLYDIVEDFMSDTNTRTFEFDPAGITTDYPKMTGECRIKKVVVDAKPPDPLFVTVDFVLDGNVNVTVN